MLCWTKLALGLYFQLPVCVLLLTTCFFPQSLFVLSCRWWLWPQRTWTQQWDSVLSGLPGDIPKQHSVWVGDQCAPREQDPLSLCWAGHRRQWLPGQLPPRLQRHWTREEWDWWVWRVHSEFYLELNLEFWAVVLAKVKMLTSVWQSHLEHIRLVIFTSTTWLSSCVDELALFFNSLHIYLQAFSKYLPRETICLKDCAVTHIFKPNRWTTCFRLYASHQLLPSLCLHAQKKPDHWKKSGYVMNLQSVSHMCCSNLVTVKPALYTADLWPDFFLSCYHVCEMFNCFKHILCIICQSIINTDWILFDCFGCRL